MKSGMKRVLSVLLMLVMVLVLLPVNTRAANEITTTPTGYTSAADVNYVKSGNYIANWGARGEDCVFLSTYAQSFYTSDYSFDKLSQQEGGSAQSNAPQSELYKTLQTFMKSKHSHVTSYDETKGLYRYTDCVSGDHSQLSSFYSGKMVASAWSSGGKTWNREHTWPNSKGLGGSDENDIMMLRPTIPTENGSRGNTAYGESSGYHDPGVSVHGDCARIALYVYVRWGNVDFMWGRGGVIENLDILLKWMAEDPVDTWEMGRNDAVQSITGTRNVFIDYPEYAWLLFGKDVPSNVTTPSHNTGVSGNPGSNTGSNSGSTGSTGGNTGSSGGNTGSSGPSNTGSYEKVTSLNTGDKVVIVAPAYNKALSMTKTGYYNIGVDVSGGFGSITNEEIFTVTKNADGTYSFVSASGKTLALADQYNSLNDTGSNKSWKLSDAGNGLFYLQTTRSDGVYLEWYASKENWSAYKPSSLNGDYQLAFYKQTGSASGGSAGGNTGSNTGSSGSNTGSNSGSTGGNTGNTGNTGSSGGNTGSTGENTGNSYADATFDKVSTINTGDKVLIVNPTYNVALSTLKTGYYNIGVDVSEGLQGITDAELFTVTKNADGSFTFVSGTGKKLALGADYSSLNEAGENAAWSLTALENGQFNLKNAARGNYLQWYADKENWSTYNPDTLDQQYALEFHKLAGSGSNDSADATEPAPEPTQPETQEPTQAPTQEGTETPDASEPIPTPPDEGGEEKSTAWIWIVVALVVLAAAGGVCYYLLVIRPKQGAAVPAEEASLTEEPSQETPVDAPSEENAEEAEAPGNENTEEN